MENAYKLAMQIADELAKEEIVKKNPTLSNKTFLEIKDIPTQFIPEKILELHKSTFEISFRILSETKV